MGGKGALVNTPGIHGREVTARRRSWRHSWPPSQAPLTSSPRPLNTAKRSASYLALFQFIVFPGCGSHCSHLDQTRAEVFGTIEPDLQYHFNEKIYTSRSAVVPFVSGYCMPQFLTGVSFAIFSNCYMEPESLAILPHQSKEVFF